MRFLAVSGAVKKSGQMSIWATAGRARGVASVMARLSSREVSMGRRRREMERMKKKLRVSGMVVCRCRERERKKLLGWMDGMEW